MKPQHANCPTCNHPLHMHTVDPHGCWWMKYTAGEWPCRCVHVEVTPGGHPVASSATGNDTKAM